MSNAEKIEILKENIKNFIINLKIDEENSIFNFAKQQAKEMKIEIPKGELKSLIYNILNVAKNNEFCDFNKSHDNYLDKSSFEHES